MISQKAQYALRALITLARSTEATGMPISVIAETAHIPKKFLEQILLTLKARGIVLSRRGKSGGYQLLRPASAITIGEVLRLIDGPIAPLPCLSLTAYRRCQSCSDEAICELRHVFARMTEAMRDILDSTTIADAIRAEHPVPGLEV